MIHVTFSREVYQKIDFMISEKGFDEWCVSDVSLHEGLILVIKYVFEACGISRVGECIQRQSRHLRDFQATT